MARALSLLLVLVCVLIGLAGLAIYLAYGTESRFEGDLPVAGLEAPVAIGYTDADLPVISARSEADLFTGLGYVHAQQSAWPMALWRQIATGSLSLWFEDSTANALDRHALTLGFGASARAAYDALSTDERGFLEAYARGVNEAFSRDRLNEEDEFVLFDVRAAPWQPWEALAVERLVAYLATPPAVGDSTMRAALRVHAPLRDFAVADSVFRTTLYIEGLDHSLAFALRDSTGSTLTQRHVAGRSALPLFREAVLRRDGQSTLAITIPGSLMMPAGYGEHAWSVLLSGTSRFVATADSIAPSPTFARIVTRSGGESLVETYRRGGAVLLFDPDVRPTAPSPPTPAQEAETTDPDSLAPPARMWELRWPGFGVGSDLSAWRALLRGETEPFTLIPGSGLMVVDGQARVLGTPPVVRDVGGGTFVGGHSRAQHVADRLAVLDRVDATPEGLLSDTYSTWAADLAPPLVAVLGGPDEVAGDLSEAAAYLRGWDFRYTPASIAASIFDVWMAVHREETGALPNPDSVALPLAPPDSVQAPPELPAVTELKASLSQALERLESEHGALGAGWRWQDVQQAIRYYPLFTRDISETGRRRFAPTARPDGGHPTTLAWGPSPAFSGPEASATWTARGQSPEWSPVRIRHRDLYDATYRTRRLVDPVEPFSLDRNATPEVTLRLVPSGD